MRSGWMLLMLPLIGSPLLTLAGCGPEQTTQREQEEAACQAQASRVDAKVNRADLAERDSSNTPLSSTGLPGIDTTPLSEAYAHDTIVNDCLNATGTPPNQ